MTRALRWLVCSLLIVAGALSTAASVIALYVHTQIENTDAYVGTVEPLASDPAVQAAVADRLTEELTRRLDVDSLVAETLGTVGGAAPRVASQVAGLAPVLTQQFATSAREVSLALVSSDHFAALWSTVNRQAHAQLSAAVTGRATDGIVRADNTGAVSVSLEPVVEELWTRLNDRGSSLFDGLPTELQTRLQNRGLTLLDRLPTLDPQFEILQSDELATAQRYSNALDRAVAWLPWVSVICAVAAITIAPKRMRALSLTGLAAAVTMIALLVALTVVRRVYVQDQDVMSPEAAVAVYEAFAASLVSNVRVLFACGVAVALAGYVAGGSRSATSMRNRLSELVGRESEHEGSTRREGPGPRR